MNTTKSILSVIILTIFLMLSITVQAAHDVKIEANWAWNGTDPTTQGFRFYLDGKTVQDIPDPAARISDWTIPLENGKHLFTMTAYGNKDGTEWESPHSQEYPFEYLYVDQQAGRPAPMVIIRIN